MSDVGQDIKEALEEIGVAINYRDVSGECIKVAPNSQITKPFISEFFVEGMVPFDSAVVVGDVITYVTTDEKFLVMSKIPDLFENEIYSYRTIFYRCNVTNGKLIRPSGEVIDGQYHTDYNWVEVVRNVVALQTDALFGTTLDEGEELGLIGLKRNELYIAHSYGILSNDRWEPVSGEYYRVETVNTRTFNGIDIAKIGEDTR